MFCFNRTKRKTDLVRVRVSVKPPPLLHPANRWRNDRLLQLVAICLAAVHTVNGTHAAARKTARCTILPLAERLTVLIVANLNRTSRTSLLLHGGAVIYRLSVAVRGDNDAALQAQRSEACSNHEELAKHVFLRRIVDQIIIDLTAKLIGL